MAQDASSSSRFPIGTLVGAVVLIALILILGNQGKPSVTGPVKVGFINPLTGDTSTLGVASKAAVELAVEEINAGGGIQGQNMEVIYEDGKCNAAAATSAANKLINIDKVSGIMGGLCSTETGAFGKLAMDSKVVTLSNCSSAPSLSNTGKYFFRSYPSDAFQGKFAAEYAYNTLKARKVAVIYHISEWGTGIKEVFSKRFKELGGEIVLDEGTTQETRDYRTVLAKAKDANPDLIYFPAYTEGGIAAMKQVQELGITTKIYGGDAWADPKFQQESSGKADIIYSEVVSPVADEFKAKMQAKTKVDQVSICSGQAYDNIKMLAQVMNKVGTDPDRVQAELHKLKYEGVTGHIEFDGNGDLKTASYVVKKIQDGKAVEVK